MSTLKWRSYLKAYLIKDKTRFNLQSQYQGCQCRKTPDHHKPHYNDVIMGTIASRITSFMIVFSTVYSDADKRKHQSSASLAFVRGIHREPVNSPHKWPVTRKMFPFEDVIMSLYDLTMLVSHGFRSISGHVLVIVLCPNINLQTKNGISATFKHYINHTFTTQPHFYQKQSAVPV